MMNVIYFIIFVLILYFIYLLIKYSGTEKPEYTLQYFRDNEYIKYSPIIVGYLNKGKVEEEHFIATVLDFVTKGYINVDKTDDNKDYIFTIIKNIEASEIETETLEIFFNENLRKGLQQTLKQFKLIIKNEKIVGNYGKLKRKFNKEIREFFDKKEDVKKITKKTNIKNIIICYVLFIISSFIVAMCEDSFEIQNTVLLLLISTISFLLFLATTSSVKYTILGNFSWILPIMVTVIFTQTMLILFLILEIHNISILFVVLTLMAIIILLDDMLQRKKTNLANTCEMIKGLKKYIIDYSNIDEYDIEKVYLWEKYYAYAVALNIKKI